MMNSQSLELGDLLVELVNQRLQRVVLCHEGRLLLKKGSKFSKRDQTFLFKTCE